MAVLAGHYTPATKRNEWVFVAGQTGEDADGALADDLATQTTQAIANIVAILEDQGAKLSDVVRMTCYVTDMTKFDVFDAAYSAALGDFAPPRTTVGITPFAGGQLVEIEATAFVQV